ncbi:MAG: GIY-YIG nuclease family protein [bacterium]|nr:GIY-YIG nuclease family protein [bacterium]
MSSKSYFVYILASKKDGIFYIGVTSDLIKRIYEHRNDIIMSFTKKYKIDKLVYFEQTNNVNAAITREKQLKNWHRQWKINLIEENNPDWTDLYSKILT